MRANPQAPIDGEHRWDVHETPLGPLTLHASARGLTGLSFPGRGGPLDDARRDRGALAKATRQLDDYFAQERAAFDLPLDLYGTPFQRRGWGGGPAGPPPPAPAG